MSGVRESDSDTNWSARSGAQEINTAGFPYFSVVITVRDRRLFLRQAVQSVLDQTLARSDYEVIVVKSFADPELDAFLQVCGARCFTDQRRELGAKMALGVRCARGRVVSFLEDDDRFKPDKLATLKRLFAGESNLVFTRDVVSAIDEAGRSLHNTRDASRRPGRSVTLRTARDKMRWTPVLLHFGMSAFVSSMSLMRSALLPAISVLENLPGGADAFLFACGMASSGRARFETSTLTEYRVHSYHSNPEAPAELDSTESLSTFISRQARYVRAHETIADFARGTPAESYARFALAWSRLRYYLISDEVVTPSLKQHLGPCRYPTMLAWEPRVLGMVLASLAKRMFPRTVTERYRAFTISHLRQGTN